MRIREKFLLSALLVGVLGTVAGLGVFGAFSSTTSSANNQLSAGTVTLADNDSNQALYSASNQKPGDTVTRCIKVTYTGTLGADVKLYTPSSIGSLGQYVDLTITPGTQSSSTFPDCTGFTPDSGGDLFSGTLQQFATSHNSYATGVSDYPAAGSSWATNDAVVYRFTVTLSNATPDSAQGATTGTHTYEWQARSQ